MSVPPNPHLVGTSLLFIIPATMNAAYRQWLLYSLSILMCLSSSIWHATKYPPLLIVDKVACYVLATTNVYYSIKYNVSLIPILACVYCVIVFHCGYLTNSFVFAENKMESLGWHMSMHLVVVSAASCNALQIHSVRYKKLMLDKTQTNATYTHTDP